MMYACWDALLIASVEGRGEAEVIAAVNHIVVVFALSSKVGSNSVKYSFQPHPQAAALLPRP